MPLLQQLANGDCAIKNDGTVEELNRVLDHCFKDDLKTNGSALYYYAVNKKWDCDYSVNIPAYSVKDFIAEMDDFGLPEKWCIRLTEENKETVGKWFNNNQQSGNNTYDYSKMPLLRNESVLHFPCWGSYNHTDSVINNGYTELSFDQFKKYVLKEEATIYKKETVDQFAVMLTDSGAPTKLHDTYESAEKECLRLVKQTKRNGYVLKVVSKIINEIKIDKICN